MSSRRALLSKGDLDRMASACAAHGVRFRGRVDSVGNLEFTLTPVASAASISNDDFEERLSDWVGS